MSTNDDPKTGRPKTSTDEQSVKLVTDAVEKDRRVTYEEDFEITGIPPTSVFRILTNDLNREKFLSDGYLTA